MKEKPIRQILNELGIGDSHTFPVSRLNTLRASCSQYGLQWGKKFSTTIKREDGVIEATRIA